MTPVIVVPVYNEMLAIASVVTGASLYAPVIVVDDGSSDGSGLAGVRAGAKVVRHAERRGKAAALRTGIAVARALGASAVVTMDGDGQHAPGDLPVLLGAARETPEQIIVGNRLTDTACFPRARLNAMVVAGFFVEWVTELGVRDTQSGFRVYPMALLEEVGVCRGGFVFETEVLIAAARHGWRVREVAVTAIPSARRRSRFRPVRDGVAIGAYLAGQVVARWVQEIAFDLHDHEGAGLNASRRRRAKAAAAATVSAPVVLAAVLLQTGLGPLGFDLVSPLVRRLYSPELVSPAIPPAASRVAIANLDASLATSRLSRP
jgi:Glycosyl transferase family 2